MLFNSLHFLLYLPIVTIVYFLLKGGARRGWMLAASFYFYAVFSLPLSLLMVWGTIIDYTAARLIQGSTNPRRRKFYLICSVVLNLATLGTFKYLDFFDHSLAAVLGFHPWPVLHLMLPMGISFYTFQAMSYTIDVYRGRLEARKSVVDFMLYVTFFPHLVAGPIMRGGDLIPQFSEKHEPNAERIYSGVLLCVWGLLKKLFVADPIGVMADSVFSSDPGTYGGLGTLLGTYAFAVQIYCDFSAYSDIAIGSGRMLGFRVIKNFDAPYLAATIRDFWHRWHISLSTWLRDYLYISLGGNRKGELRTYVNLMLTMLLGGLWHGASWTFVIWGGLHGLYLAVERKLGIDTLDPERMTMAARLLRGFVTFHLVCLAWIFFRAPSAAFAFDAVAAIATWRPGLGLSLAPVWAILAIVGVEALKRRFEFEDVLLRHPNVTRWGVYAALVLIVTALAGGRSSEFIYFQF